MLWLGTRASVTTHPFEKMLSGADYVQSHFATSEDNPFHLRTWRKANPGLDAMPDLLAAIRKESTRARKDADKLAQFRALRLNMGVSDTVERFVLSAATWEAIERPNPELVGRYCLGVDLGASASMSAVSGYWPESGALRVLGMFPENPTLADRGLNDGVGELYTRAQDQGELVTGGDEISDVPALMALALGTWGPPSKVVCDDWRKAELDSISRRDTVGKLVVTIGVGDQQGRQFEDLEVTVDTRSTFTAVPRTLLQRLGVPVRRSARSRLADGSTVPVGIGWTVVRLEDHIFATQVIFAEENEPSLLGVVTLEDALLAVDTVGQRLVPVEAERL